MKPQRALTLMELLVVVAAAALLAGIALPSLQSARRLAKPERCKWNQAKVAEAIFLYAEDFDDAIPYSLDKKRGFADILLSWDVVIGKIPAEYFDKDWENWPLNEHGFPNYHDANSVEAKIVTEGYIDYLSWGDNEIVPYEGAFVCPAFVDQVEPKATWPGGTSCQFSINGNVSDRFAEWGNDELVITHLSDVRGKAVLIGDGNLGPAGNINVEHAYRTHRDTGKLYVLDANYPWDFGPWTHQQHISKWSVSMPCDFYGHPGGKANLALADGHVRPVRNLDGNDWIIEPLDEEGDGNEEE